MPFDPLEHLAKITDIQNIKAMIDECPEWGSIIVITNYAKDEDSEEIVPSLRVARINETYFGTIGMLHESLKVMSD